MKLRVSQPTYEKFDAELIDAPSNVPGKLAMRRKDTGEIIALRDIVGTPSTAKYQLLDVTPEEKAALEQEGLVIALTVNYAKKWYDPWGGTKPPKKSFLF